MWAHTNRDILVIIEFSAERNCTNTTSLFLRSSPASPRAENVVSDEGISNVVSPEGRVPSVIYPRCRRYCQRSIARRTIAAGRAAQAANHQPAASATGLCRCARQVAPSHNQRRGPGPATFPGFPGSRMVRLMTRRFQTNRTAIAPNVAPIRPAP